MNNFNKIFKMIFEENGIKIIFTPSGSKKFNFSSFPPFEYNGVSVFQSSFHDDLNHVLNQLNIRTNKKYTLNDIFIIIKRGINEFKNQLKYKKFRNKQSFNIISKSYPEIKVACAIEINDIKNELIYLDFKDDNKLYHNDYFCFIYTVLLSYMHKKPLDYEIFVEENVNKEEINLFVE